MNARPALRAVALALLAAGAQAGTDGTTAHSHKEIAMADVSEDQLAGISAEDARSRFGEPQDTDSFVLSGRVTEFRIELLNRYSRERIDTDPPRITERTWSVGPGRNLTIWFEDGSESYVHHMEWDADEEF